MRFRVPVVVLAILALSPLPRAGAACGFTRLPSPNKGTDDNFPLVVDATSPGNAWVAGFYRDPVSSNSYPQTWHWNGNAWDLVKTPVPGNGNLWGTNVGGIAALGNGDAWLSGNWLPNAGPQHSLLMHYTGGAWKIVRVPRSIRTNAGLAGIDARGPNDVWAVGNAGSDSFVIHYDGRRWRKMAVPDAGTTGNYLDSVAVVPGSKQVWVAGTYSGPATEGAYLVRWNGRKWRVFPASQPGPQVHLYDIDAAAKNDIWTVGYLTGQPNTWGGVTFHFDGSIWTYEPSPDPSLDFPGTFLYGVAALGADGAFASGDSNSAGPGPSYQDAVLVDSWDGAAWNMEAISGVTNPSSAYDTVPIPGTNKVWIVAASYVGGRFETVFLRGC